MADTCNAHGSERLPFNAFIAAPVGLINAQPANIDANRSRES
jgi:hypothetical protein